MGGFAKKVLAPSTLVLETLALEDGLHFVERTRTEVLQFNEQSQTSTAVPVQLVTDNSTAGNAILGRAEVPWAVQLVVADCQQNLGSLLGVSVAVCPRETNWAADWIAKACRDDSLATNWLCNPSHCLTSLLCLDLGKCPRIVPTK